VRVELVAPAGGWHEPWPTVFEIAETLGAPPMVLVGGLMVQIHSRLANIGEIRPTRDVDILIDLLAGDITVGVVAGALQGRGFELQTPKSSGAPAHRFVRGDDVVDLLSPDHQSPAPRLGGRPVMQIDGGRQALGKLLDLEVHALAGSIGLRIPDRLGALILKSAAHRSDPRDRDRHLRDAALLSATIDDPLAERERLVGSDSRRLRYLAEQLRDPFLDAWQLLPAEARTRGQDAVRILSSAATPPT
jgi:hypothetical protein